MCCCNDKLAESNREIAGAIVGFTQELVRWRCLLFPLHAPTVDAIGETKAIDQETDEMSTVLIVFETQLNNLPAAIGRDGDIAKGIFVVMADGAEYSRQDVAYDLTTRAPLAPVRWKAPVGADVTRRLEYVDDKGNASPFLDSHWGIVTDEVAPDAPTDMGVTKAVDQETVADIPPSV